MNDRTDKRVAQYFISLIAFQPLFSKAFTFLGVFQAVFVLDRLNAFYMTSITKNTFASKRLQKMRLCLIFSYGGAFGKNYKQIPRLAELVSVVPSLLKIRN